MNENKPACRRKAHRIVDGMSETEYLTIRDMASMRSKPEFTGQTGSSVVFTGRYNIRDLDTVQNV